MISSTVLDLPEHRASARDGCMAANVFPDMMESLPARDQDAIDTSLGMVNRADIFIGIYAFRYGHVPKGGKVSITEMELERAEERAQEGDLTILPFLMDPAHPVTADMVEANAAVRRKLDKLKVRVAKGRGRALFKSPVELRGQVETALKELTIRSQTKDLLDSEQTMLLLRLDLESARAELRDRDADLKRLQNVVDRLKAAIAKKTSQQRRKGSGNTALRGATDASDSLAPPHVED
jgi:hypothetical protein